MGEVASAYVSIFPKVTDGFAKQLQAQISAASGTAFGPIDQKSGEAGKSAGKKFGDSFRGVAGPILAVASVGAIAAFAGKAVDAFAELQDATAAASVVFGDSMDKIIESSDEAAASFGISKQQSIDAAMTFGTFGKSAGLAGDNLAKFSTDMAGLAGDMASFRGTSPEQAIEAIGSALRGESEPIRAYGVLLDDATLRARALKMGLIDTTKDALSPQNKVLAAQAEILAQTADAQGDFARTADSTANVQKRLRAESADLSAEIGEKLAPAIVEAQRAGIGLIEWATRSQSVLVPVVATLGSLALAVGGFVAASKGLEALKTARAMVAGLGDAFQAMGTKAKIASVSAGAIGIALVTAGAIYGAFAQKQADAQKAVEDYTTALEADNGALAENVRNTIAKRLEDAHALEAAQTLGISLGDVTDAVLNGGAAMDKVNSIMASHSDQMGEQTAESVRMGEAARLLTGLLGGENAELNNAVAAEKRKAEATKDGTTATTTSTTATKANSVALETNAEKLNKLYNARLKLRGDKRALEAAIDSATESLKKNGKTLDTNTEKGRANQQALDDIAAAGLAVGGNMDKSRSAFIKAATSMGMAKDEAKKLADKLGLIKSKKVTVEAHVVKTGISSISVVPGKSSGKFVMVAKAAGGAIEGGIPGVDSVPALLMPGEHVLTAAEVRAMGGHRAVYRLRAMVRSNALRFANGGAVQTGAAASVGPTVQVVNHYPQAEPTSVTVNRALQSAAALGVL